MKTKSKKTDKKAFMERMKMRGLFVVAVFLSILFCIESISNGSLNTLDWIGISVSAVIIIWWIMTIGIFINRKKTEKENRELEEIKKNIAKQASEDENNEFFSEE